MLSELRAPLSLALQSGVLNRFNKGSSKHSPKRPIYSLEATGLILISILILVLILIRYWQYIAWSAR
jgi:hypothetical protein